MDETAKRDARPSGAPVASPADEARLLFERAIQFQRAGDLESAFARYCELIERFPSLPDPYNNLAVLLKSQRRLPAAIACLKRALQLAPNSGPIHSNLGNLQWMALEFEDSMASFRRALALDPNRPEVHHNLGLLHFSLCNYRAAIECYDRSLALAPGGRLVQWDRALALLADGDYGRGFAAYDVRFDLEDPSMGFDRKLRRVRSMPMPLWQGEEIAGRTIYVYAEQGLGDTLQFARFVPSIARLGARIIFDVPADLARLLANFPGVAQLRVEGNEIPKADFHLPLMSVAHRLGITLASLPGPIPYIAAPATGPALSRPPGTRLAAGIVWSGRPQHTNDQNRSLTLESLLTLCDLPGLTLYSLQKGPRAGDIEALGARAVVRDLSPLIHDFADTARLIMQLDLVISVDTAVAHLAAAMGRPTFLLIPFTPDWRWLAAREDSPWYPTARLFRQPARRDWTVTIRRIHDTLARSLGIEP
jgi:tetratricopeptide (TPR) repeat protein